jgi:glycosyltransferase involved in cell wall biosynthesis
MIKVSIVIPCYNQGQYVDEAVDSMLNQTFQDIEIVVVNDGSTDTLTIKKLQHYDKPKTTVLHTNNQGLPHARNNGIKESIGEYILPLDADDYFAPTFLEKAVDVLNAHPEVGIVTCGMQCFGISQKRHLPKGGDVTNFLGQNNACVASMFRRVCWEQAGGYNETPKGYEDWNLWLGMTKRGWLAHVIPEYLFYYRRRPDSMIRESDAIKPELIKQLVNNHRELFEQYVDEVVSQKEQKIFALKQVKQMVLESNSYRLGQLLSAPFRMIARWRKGDR